VEDAASNFLIFFLGYKEWGIAGSPLGRAKARDLHPDLIILDASMPRISGLEAAPILRSMDDGVPIILFTMHAEARLGFRSKRCGNYFGHFEGAKH